MPKARGYRRSDGDQPPEDRACKNPNCNKTFSTTRSKKIYCSDRCRFAAWDQKHPRAKPKLIHEFPSGDKYWEFANGSRIIFKEPDGTKAGTKPDGTQDITINEIIIDDPE